MGYAPMMAYIGKEGYLVNTELREGKQHCHSGTPEFLRQTMKLCRRITDKPILVRLDSGNDAAENVGIMLENCAYYVIKRNLRKEDRTEWAENIKSWCKDISEPREGKNCISVLPSRILFTRLKLASRSALPIESYTK